MTLARVPRREFLQGSALSLAGLALARVGSHGQAAADEAKTADQLIAGKDPRLIVHSAEPAEFETPLGLLAENRITPAALLFVRNNQALAGANTLAPTAVDDWTIEIGGLVGKSASIRVKELAQLPQFEQELVLQCSGNGRAMFSKITPAKGAPWQCGAMGNVRFAGVPLTKVFERLGVTVDSQARFLTAAGRDLPAKPDEADFEHSIPLDDARARSFIALQLNGQPIPAAHGGPVRLITPGYYATMNVKWLSQLRFESQETTNYHQVRRYRTPKEQIAPGSAFTYDLTNSDPNWRMRTKSVIVAPLDGQRVQAGRVEVRGVAWNDGRATIDTVLVSSGPGNRWQPATIEASENRYAWQHWSLTLELGPGTHTLAVRAIDTLGRSQPSTAAANWNPAGYAFNGVHTVNVVVR